MHHLSDDDEDSEEEENLNLQGLITYKNANLQMKNYDQRQLNNPNHQDSTSICPDSAPSKKRQPPQKTGTVKPGYVQNHYYEEESVLSDALKVTSPLLIKDSDHNNI